MVDRISMEILAEIKYQDRLAGRGMRLPMERHTSWWCFSKRNVWVILRAPGKEVLEVPQLVCVWMGPVKTHG